MDRYLFFHVPKTAGTSLREYFRQVLGSNEVGPSADFLGSSTSDYASVTTCRMVVGHFSFEQVAHFPGRRILTFLRNPVDVVVSTYYFFRNTPAVPSTPHVLLCRELSLRGVLERADSLKTFFNDAVHRFAGEEGYTLPDREALALAKQNLAACDFVGIHEQMADSLLLMSDTFGWPLLSMPRANVTSGRPALGELDPELAGLIVQATSLDQELYRFGLELFEQRRSEALRRLIGSRLPSLSDSLSRETSATTATGVPEEQGGWAASDRVPERPGSGEVRILAMSLVGCDTGRSVVSSGERCEVRMTLLANVKSPEVSVVMRLFNSAETLVYSTRSSREGRYLDLEPGAAREIVFDIPMAVSLGSYYVDLEVNSSAGATRRVLDYVHRACGVDVSGFTGIPFGGIADLGAEIYTVEADHGGAEYEIGHEIDFSDGGNSQLYTRSGWGYPEDGPRWTDGPKAEMLCRLPPPSDGDLLLTALVHPYCPEGTLEVTAVVNGRELARWGFAAPGRFTDLEMEIPAEVCRAGYLHVLFMIDRPRVPAASGKSQDYRALGLAFQRMVICEAGLRRPGRRRARTAAVRAATRRHI